MRCAIRSSAPVALVLLLQTACGDAPQAELQVELIDSARLTPQVFHGNCLAGYALSMDLRVRETQGVDMVLDALDYRLRDEGAGTDLGGEGLDADALDARYGPAARGLEGRGATTFRIAVPSDRGVGAGPISISGHVGGRDANGHRVTRSYALQSAVQLQGDEPEPGAGGACSTSPS